MPNNLIEKMKKLGYIFVIVFAFATLVSCSAKKRGCGLTADATEIPSQEIVVSEVEE